MIGPVGGLSQLVNLLIFKQPRILQSTLASPQKFSFCTPPVLSCSLFECLILINLACHCCMCMIMSHCYKTGRASNESRKLLSNAFKSLSFTDVGAHNYCIDARLLFPCSMNWSCLCLSGNDRSASRFSFPFALDRKTTNLLAYVIF